MKLSAIHYKVLYYINLIILSLTFLIFINKNAVAIGPTINSTIPLFSYQSNIIISWSLSGEWYLNKSCFTYVTCTFGNNRQTSPTHYGSEGKSIFNTSFILNEGDNVITIFARNGTGTNSNSYIISYETAKPIISISSPNSPTSNNKPTWSWVLENKIVSGIKKYQYRFNSSDSWTDNSPLTSTSYTPTNPLADGVYSIRIRALSNAEVTGDETVAAQVLIDTAKPEVSIKSPDSPTFNNKPTWCWTLDNNIPSGILKYQIRFDDSDPWVDNVPQTSTTYTPSTPLPNGAYQIWIRAVSNSGVIGDETISDTEVVIHSSGPELGGVVVDPTGTFRNNRPLWSWDAPLNADHYRIVLLKEGSVYFRDDSYRSTTYQPTLPDGTYVLSVVAVDTSGNESAPKSSAIVTIDTTGPGLGEIIVEPSGSTKNPQPKWSWNAPPDAVGYKVVLIKDNVEYFRDNAFNNTSYQPVLPDGEYQLIVIAVDLLGNESTPKNSAAVKIDSTGPDLGEIIVEPSGSTKNPQPKWSWNAPPDAVGYKVVLIKDGVEYYRDNAFNSTSYQPALPDGKYHLIVIAVDLLGNESRLKNSATVSIDTTGPDLGEINVEPSGSTKNYQPKWSWNAPADAVGYKVVLIKDNVEYFRDNAFNNTSYQPALPDGEYQMTVIAVDLLGNESAPKSSATVTIDTTGPDLGEIIVEPSGSTKNSQPKWSWNAPADAVGYKVVLIKDGVEYYRNDAYSTTIFQPKLDDGTYRLAVVAIDRFGNESEVKNSASVTIKITCPEMSDISVSPSGITNNPQPIWSWNSPNGEKYRIMLLKNGVTCFKDDTFSNTTYRPILQDGDYQLKVVAVDTFGNESAIKSSSVVTIDTQPPSAPKIKSSGSSISNRYNLIWTGGDEDPNFEKYQVFVDSGHPPVYTGSEQKLEITLTKEITTLEVVAYDKAGNFKSSGIINVNFDRSSLVAPRITSSHYSNTSNYTLAWNCDNSDTNIYEVFCDSGTTPVYRGSNQSFSVDLLKTVTQFKVVVYDEAMNNRVSDQFEVTLDTQNPILYFTPGNNEVVSITKGSTIIVDLLDRGSGINPTSILMTLDSAVVTPVRMMRGAQECILHYIYRGPFVPSHAVQVMVKDLAGNETSGTVTFTIENKRLGFGFGRFRY